MRVKTATEGQQCQQDKHTTRSTALAGYARTDRNGLMAIDHDCQYQDCDQNINRTTTPSRPHG